MLILVCLSLAPGQTRAPRPAPLEPTTVYLTYDDGPDNVTPQLARWLNARGIRATFFVNLCRIENANLTSLWTGNCFPQPGHQPMAILPALVSLGHVIGNHTYDHVDLTQPGLPAAEPEYQLESAQRTIEQFQGGFHPFRAPNLKWNSHLDDLVKDNPYLSRMTGPIGCDYCGGGYVNGTAVGGDWDCLAKGYGIPACAQLYVDAIRKLSRTQSEIVVLLHDRLTSPHTGTDTALRFTKYLLTQLRNDRLEYRPLGPEANAPSMMF